MKRSFFLRTVLVTVIGTISFAASTLAQVANNTAVVGTVLDSSGSVLAGAKVTAVEESTGVVFPGTTNDQGYYCDQVHSSGHIRHHRRADRFCQVDEDRHNRAH